MERIIIAVMVFMIICGCIGSSPEGSECAEGKVLIDGVCCSDLDSDGVCDPTVTTLSGSGDGVKDLAVASSGDAVSAAGQSQYVSEALSDGSCSQFAWSNLKMVLHVEDWQLTSCTEGGRGLDFCSGFEYGMSAGDASNKAKLSELFGKDLSDFYLIVYACSSDVNYIIYLDSETGDVKGEKINLWGSGSDPTTCNGFAKLKCIVESINVIVDETQGEEFLSGNISNARLSVNFENTANFTLVNISVKSTEDLVCIPGTENFSENSLESGKTGLFTCTLMEAERGSSFMLHLVFNYTARTRSNQPWLNHLSNGWIYGVVM